MMNNEQYQRWTKADDAGKKKIEAEGLNGRELIIDVEPIAIPTVEDIELGLADGKSKAEIGEDFGVSAQKIGSILKKSK